MTLVIILAVALGTATPFVLTGVRIARGTVRTASQFDDAVEIGAAEGIAVFILVMIFGAIVNALV
jgi:uncharacterized membrane protein